MKKTIILFVMMLVLSSLSAQTTIVGSGNLVKKEYLLDTFTAVDIKFIGNVYVYQGLQHRTVVTADDNVIENVQVDIKNGKLCICMKKNISYSKVKINVDVFLPQLEELNMYGPGDVTVQLFKEPTLSINNSGAGNCMLIMPNIENSLELYNKGCGNIETHSAGPVKSNYLLIHNSGAGDINIHTQLYSTSTVVINNQGSGDVLVNMMNEVCDALTMQNKGAGALKILNLNVKQMELKTGGAGDVRLTGKAESIRIADAGSGNVSAELLKAKTAHITHNGTGHVKAYVTDTAYVTNKYTMIGKLSITGAAKVVSVD